MQLLAAIFIYALNAAAAGASTDENRETECVETKAKIRKIESRMRQGYSAKQGVRSAAIDGNQRLAASFSEILGYHGRRSGTPDVSHESGNS
jgi:hypothetical protein